MNGRLKPFERTHLSLPPLDQWVQQVQREHPDTPKEVAEGLRAGLLEHEVWTNNEYQVNVDKQPEHGFGGDTVLWHLSIKRLNKAPVHDWRDLQAIKNVLVGPEFEAIEIYPASDRVVDSANQYHLFVFVEIDGKRAPKMPFGWTTRYVDGRTSSSMGARQRGLHQEGATL